MDAPSTGTVTIDTPLGADIVFHSMSGAEAISVLFAYEIVVLSPRADLDPARVLGVTVTVHVLRTDQGDEPVRYFSGCITAFEYVGTGDDASSMYRLTMRPRLWYLTQIVDCRIFQNLSIPDIITTLLNEQGISHFESALAETYEQKEYVVQYRETDFDFISRLMQREGIYFFFRHGDGAHTLVLADSPDGHATFPDCATLPYAPRDAHRDESREYVREWRAISEIATNRASHADYDFTHPRLGLHARADATRVDDAPLLEAYDYPGGFSRFGQGDAYAYLRMNQRRSDAARWTGETNARAFAVGYTFGLTDHPREDQNKKYLAVSAEYRVAGHDVRSNAGDEVEVLSCRFRVIPAERKFFSPVALRKPLVLGPQTAVVVGPAGRDIWMDQYGRVKVQFHWDRRGQDNENSSCFVRVMQAWAGSGFGAQFIPRIGHEVIVEFIEGDVDRPIITGSVYNGANATPFRLTEHETQSGVRTRSTPGGTQVNANEIRFEDMGGREELYVQAEKDMNVLVKNDQRVEVGGKRSTLIGASDQLDVRAWRTATVGIDDSTTVGAVQTVTVGGAQNVAVAGLQTISVGVDRSVRVLGNETTDVGRNRTVTVAGDLRRTVTGRVDTDTAGDHHETFGGAFVARHAGHRVVVVGDQDGDENAVLHVEGSAQVYASTTLEAEALGDLTLRCGQSVIQIKPDSITISSPKITLVTQDAEVMTAKFNVAATGTVTIGGSTVTAASSGASVTLDSNASVQGAQVKLGAGSGGAAQGPDPAKPPTTLELLDLQGNPLANQRVVLRYGGQGGEERSVVLGDKGTIVIPGEDPFEVLFPDTQDPTKS